jgi:signal transduction histidine kinase
MLTQAFESENKPDSALKYMKAFLAIKDTIFSRTKLEQIQLLNFQEGQRQRDIDLAKERYQNELKLYALLAAVGIFVLISVILYSTNRQKQRANRLLSSQKNEINKQRNAAEKNIDDLKSAQAQLIQSEKMASLGELTAGIAHEIQNPLNFVNNFSEINSELLAELDQEIDKGNRNSIGTIVANLKENEEKIAVHGQRADSIVKGMLQHSKKTSGQKEPTDINALCDEYLRLSYHGMRAKDKSFNVAIQTDLDKHIGNVPLIPQDIGRVLLNLYNNAFFAVMEKMKDANAKYQPVVKVCSKKVNETIEIRVSDNGTGIAEAIREKIFQPFFTTKPSGQGTGLGLSLSYDIIKAHGGKITVETKEGDGSEFIIHLRAD